MADDNKPLDLDNMSDEEFMKLNPNDIEEVIPDEEEEIDEPIEEVSSESETDSDKNDTTPGPDDESVPKPNVDEEEEEYPDSDKTDEDPKPDSDSEDSVVVDEETPPKGKGTDEESAKPDGDKKPKEKTGKESDDVIPPVDAETSAAVDFFNKVSAPFKADGREMKVRTPEDVIRLMQMGVNYSRRMEEMKPLRAQDQMLKANGLNDPEKLNFLIDLSKGNPEAIKQLLKDHKIDPIDIDTSEESSPYQAKNYQADPKDLAFEDAIQNTIKAEGGVSLIQDINKDWDDTSKEALKEQPSIFQNLLEQKSSGVYSKIKTELDYQRTMGFLTDVPFLQAYHQVGEAMQKAGVFNTEEQVQPEPKKVLGTGTRKAAPKPKTEQPTPNVSSATQPRSAPANAGRQENEPDFASMSDEDFLKLAPPS